ncbi:MAG: Ig-like domain-containing protein [Candidatus Peribacteraceae bacterium]|nr:Ig-like domain-containing protein [Candidatus Peribacteraceae bacterium]
MAIVQPGKVPTYAPDPAVSLTNYDDSDRTRFIFNGSQFVKASLIRSVPSFVYVGLAPDGDTYKFYKTSDGKYALSNSEKYIPVATGAPASGSAESVVVNYPVTVSTDEIVLWGTSMISYYDTLYVEYSYDGNFYFTISGSSVSWSFQDTEQQTPGESPPSGLYKFVIDLGATYSARYFRISAYQDPLLSATLSVGATTINVVSTTGFPSEWLSFGSTYVYGNTAEVGYTGTSITYTGKTGSTFTGVSYETTMSGSYAEDSSGKVFFKPSFADDLTEVEVLSTSSAIMEFWNSDGSSASSQTLVHDLYYDIVYDKSDDVYFTIRLNEDINGSGGIGFSTSDNFNYSVATLDSTRWSESETETNFQVNTSSGTLDYLISSAAGRINTNYYMAADFTSVIDIGFNEINQIGSAVELRSIDTSTNNVFVSMALRGEWVDPSPKTSTWATYQVLKTTDTTAGTAAVKNLRIDLKYLSVSQTFTFVYSSVSEAWSVTSSVLGAMAVCTPGVDYTEGPIALLNMVHDGSPADSVQIVLSVNYQSYASGGADPWSWKLGLKRIGGSVVSQYNQGAGLINWVTYVDSSILPLNLELFADGDSGTIDLSMDNFSVTGSETFSSVPVLTVEAVDANGDTVEVSGLTDVDGNLIKAFDVINDTLTYNSFTGNRVQIASDNTSESSGGSIYVKIGGDIYKYNKSQFPLVTEDGSNAVLYKASVIPETSAYAFSYNGYSNAGLCYVEYDEVRAGTYLKTIDTTTASGTEYESFLDVATSDYPWAWDQNNFTVFYYLSSTNLKEYDMDENDVAFCNVSSTEKIMAAGTSSTSEIDATVLNVYGEPLSAKSVSFLVSAGAGAVSPASDCTNASGIAETTYTVGETVGITTITSTASDVAC